MDSLPLEVIVILILLVANGVFAMAEMALVSARRILLQQHAEGGSRGARAALELAAAPNRFLSTAQIGITLIGILAGAFGGVTIAGKVEQALLLIPGVAPYAKAAGFIITVVFITYLTLVIGELVPKRIALNHAEAIAAAVAPVMKALSRLAAPAVFLLSHSTELGLRLLGIKHRAEIPVTEEEVKFMIARGTQGGVFEPTEQKMVERVLRLNDRPVSSLMTPRPDVIWLDPNEPIESIQQKLSSTSHSHYPIAEGQIDRIIGLVNAKDLLAQNLSCRPIDLKSVLRPAMFIPESTSSLDVLERFKESRTHVALVIDEHGGFQGLVTTSDVLEAIVGEMPMPGETSEPDIVTREDGSWLVDGAVLADELKELLRVDRLPFEDQNVYQTLGGLVMACLGRMPKSGDQFEWIGFRFEVVDMDGHRVDKVLVKPAAASEPGSAQA